MNNYTYIQQTIKSEAGDLFTGEKIISVNKRMLILGAAGSGKTTLCQYLYGLMLKKYKHIQPYLINARNLKNIDFQDYFETEILSRNKCSNEFYFFIDGLDEIIPEYYHKVLLSIATFFSNNDKYQIIITSRLSVNFDCLCDFEKYELQSLSSSDVNILVKKYFKEKTALDFIDFTKNNKIEVNNPLLLTFSLEAFKSYKPLPNNRYRIMELAIERLLSSWDSLKEIFVRSNNSLGDNIKTLSLLSYYLEINQKQTFSLSDFHKIYKSEDYEIVLSYFVQGGILVKEGYKNYEAYYSFIHLSFQEYFLVKYFQAYFRVEQKSNILLHFSPYLFELIVDSENINAASNYLYHTDIENTDILYKLIDLFNHKNKKETIKDEIIKKEWGSLLKQQNRLEKGKLLESFVANLLSIQFNIISRNLLTHNGEFDLVIENKSDDPFWPEFGTDYFVECKFWSEKVPIKEIWAFSKKTENSRVKLGFFISLSGFTKDSLRAIENIVCNPISPIIVPITKNNISNYLSSNKQSMNDFLKQLVRDIKYMKKY